MLSTRNNLLTFYSLLAVSTAPDITLCIEACNKSADCIRDGTDYIAGLKEREVASAAMRPVAVTGNTCTTSGCNTEARMTDTTLTDLFLLMLK